MAFDGDFWLGIKNMVLETQMRALSLICRETLGVLLNLSVAQFSHL